MVMYSHTRNISFQAQKLGDLEEIYAITNAKSFPTNPRSFSEKVKEILTITFRHRRGNDHEKALGEVLQVLNRLVNSQRLEAKEDLYTLLKEEEAEDTTND